MFDVANAWGNPVFANNNETICAPEGGAYHGAPMLLVDTTSGRSCKLCYIKETVSNAIQIGVGRLPYITGQNGQQTWMGGPLTEAWGIDQAAVTFNGNGLATADDAAVVGDEVCAEVRTLPNGTRTMVFAINTIVIAEIPAPNEPLYLGASVRNGACVTPTIRKSLILDDGDPQLDCGQSSWVNG